MAHALVLLIVAAAILTWALVRPRPLKKRNSPSRLQAPAHGKLPTPAGIEPLSSFRWQDTRPVQFRPFKPVYHITMALQSTSPDDLIIMDRDYKSKIETRRRVIAKHPETAMGVLSSADGTTPLPASKAAVDEVYTYLMSCYLPARYPTVFSKTTERDGTVLALHNRITGSTFPCLPPVSPLAALRILAETVEDDIFLLKAEDTSSSAADGGPAYPATSHRLVAFVCCFPSGFDPSSKLGLLLRDIHKPVPSYDRIGPSMERVFSRLEVGRSVKRLNWAVQTHTDLFSPGYNHIHEADAAESDADLDIETARLRVECQTLTRLPQTTSVLFSFKTYLFPVQDIKAEGMGPELADAIEGLKEGNAPGMWTYKGGMRWGRAVCAYLRQ